MGRHWVKLVEIESLLEMPGGLTSELKRHYIFLQKILLRDSKFPMNININGCVFPVVDWQSVQEAPCLPPPRISGKDN